MGNAPVELSRSAASKWLARALLGAISAVALLTALAVGHSSDAAFTSQTANPGNSMSAAASFGTLDRFEIDAVADQSSGSAFSVTVRAKDASGATVTGFSGTVSFSVNSGSVTPTTSNSFSNGVLTQNITITGPYSAAQRITVTGGSPSRTGTSNAFVLHDWKYYFAKSTANTGTNCPGSSRKRDMLEGYAGSDPEETVSKDTGSPLLLCTDTLSAGSSLAAGTATVNAYFDNTAGSTCTITATLLKNGATLLGFSSFVVPGSSPTTLRSWTMSTSATTFAAGDRLMLTLSWESVQACKSTDLHYGGTTNRSYLQLSGP